MTPPLPKPATDDCGDLLQAILAHGPYMVIAIDACYRILSINRVVEGMRVEDVIGTSALDYMPTEGHAAVRRVIDEVLHTGAPGRFETGGLVSDGSYGWWATLVLPVSSVDGAARALLLTTDITAERRAVEALRTNEARLRALADASFDVVYRMGPDWTDMHHLDGRDFIRDPHEPKRDWLTQYIPPEEHARVQAAIDEAIRERRPFELEHRVRRADGRIGWTRSRAVPRLDERGAILEWVGTAADVTDRKEAQFALAESEQRLRAIVDGTTDAVYVKDLQGRYQLVNRPAWLPFASDASQVLGRTDAELVPPETAKAILEHDRLVLSTGKVVNIQLKFPAGDGAVHTYHSTKGPLRNDQGQVIGLFGIARDVTDLLRREEQQRLALERSNRLLDLALGGAELGTWDVDLVNDTAGYDERYCAMLGYRATEIPPTRQAWLAMMHPDDLPTVLEAVQAHERGDTRIYETEHRLRHKDGHWVWVLARGKILRDAGGRPVLVAGTHMDISDRKRVATEGTALLKRIEGLIAGLGSTTVADPRAPGQGAAPDASGSPLRGRGRQVLGLMAAGLTAAEIAQRLGISKETANTHRRNLMRKLGLRNKAELIRYAIENGIGERGQTAAGD